VKPAVIAGDGMHLGDCVMETELGSVDLGVRAQLGEIERGFFDCARRDPGPQVEEADNMAEEVYR
jgi:flagellar biosynthesis/type III secretory pathway protein FliH